MTIGNKLYLYSTTALKIFYRTTSLKDLFFTIAHFNKWNFYLQPAVNPVLEKIPWMSFRTIRFLEKQKFSGINVFEYGSGGSTLFWAARARQVVSIEHDGDWYQRMAAELFERKLDNVQCILIEPEPDTGFGHKNNANPADYISSDPRYRGKHFEKYVKQIDNYPDEYFDVVVVDGRARPSCIRHAIVKLRKDGLLIVDNTERRHYQPSVSFRADQWAPRHSYGPVPFSASFSQTSIFKKLY
jgi:hypothetical protein